MSTKPSMSTSFPRFVDILRPTKNVLEPPLFLLRRNTSALFLWVPASFITITFDLKERLVVNRSPAFFDYLLKCVDLINISHNTFVQCLEYCIPKSFFIIRSFLPDFARSAFLSLFSIRNGSKQVIFLIQFMISLKKIVEMPSIPNLIFKNNTSHRAILEQV